MDAMIVRNRGLVALLNDAGILCNQGIVNDEKVWFCKNTAYARQLAQDFESMTSMGGKL